MQQPRQSLANPNKVRVQIIEMKNLDNITNLDTQTLLTDILRNFDVDTHLRMYLQSIITDENFEKFCKELNDNNISLKDISIMDKGIEHTKSIAKTAITTFTVWLALISMADYTPIGHFLFSTNSYIDNIEPEILAEHGGKQALWGSIIGLSSYISTTVTNLTVEAIFDALIDKIFHQEQRCYIEDQSLKTLLTYKNDKKLSELRRVVNAKSKNFNNSEVTDNILKLIEPSSARMNTIENFFSKEGGITGAISRFISERFIPNFLEDYSAGVLSTQGYNAVEVAGGATFPVLAFNFLPSIVAWPLDKIFGPGSDYIRNALTLRYESFNRPYIIGTKTKQGIKYGELINNFKSLEGLKSNGIEGLKSVAKGLSMSLSRGVARGVFETLTKSRFPEIYQKPRTSVKEIQEGLRSGLAQQGGKKFAEFINERVPHIRCLNTNENKKLQEETLSIEEYLKLQKRFIEDQINYFYLLYYADDVDKRVLNNNMLSLFNKRRIIDEIEKECNGEANEVNLYALAHELQNTSDNAEIILSHLSSKADNADETQNPELSIEGNSIIQNKYNYFEFLSYFNKIHMFDIADINKTQINNSHSSEISNTYSQISGQEGGELFKSYLSNIIPTTDKKERRISSSDSGESCETSIIPTTYNKDRRISSSDSIESYQTMF